MAWIRIVPDDEARGELAELYERHRTSHGDVDYILKIHSLNPRSLQLHYDYYKWVMAGPSGLSRAQREMIAVVVSATNGCHY
jgi:alkylhydroperoxidase family enzyme